MVPDHLKTVVAVLKGERPQGEVIKPGDTGDDMAWPPDPGGYEPPKYTWVNGKMPSTNPRGQ